MSNIQKYSDNNQVATIDPISGLPESHFGIGSKRDLNLIVEVSKRYGLDPANKEVGILHGQIYIQAKGLGRIALNNTAFDGCSIDIIKEDWDRGEFVVKASVYLKGCSQPVTDYGSSYSSQMNGNHNRLSHAITRARTRAYRAAFAIPFPEMEEVQPTQQPAQQPAQQPLPQTTPQIDLTEGERQLRSLRASKTVEELETRWQGCSYRNLLIKEAAEIKDGLIKKKAEKKAEETPRDRAHKSCHALVSEKIDNKNCHQTLRELSGVPSLTKLSDDEYADLCQKLSDYDPKESATEGAVSAAKEFYSIDKPEDKATYWVKNIESIWKELTIADRVMLLTAKDAK